MDEATKNLLETIAKNPVEFYNELYKELCRYEWPLVYTPPKATSQIMARVHTGELLLVPMLSNVVDWAQRYGDWVPCHTSGTWISDSTLVYPASVHDGWIAIELVSRPSQNGAAYTDDRLAAELGIPPRVEMTHVELFYRVFPEVAKLWGLHRERVRLQTFVEWNFVGNLLRHLNRKYDTSLPDFGETDHAEWTEDRYDTDEAMIVGGKNCRTGIHNSGLSVLSHSRRNHPGSGWRLVGELGHGC